MQEAVCFSPKILVGVDGSPNSASALAWAIAAARARQASVDAVYVWQVPALAYSAPGYIAMGEAEVDNLGRQLLEQALDGIETGDVKVSLRTVTGAPAGKLIRAAQDPDAALVVVGAQGHSGIAGLLLGSVSHALTHHCPKPLAIVPAEWNSAVPEIGTRKIVVGVDGSYASERALAWAIADAAARGADVEAVMVWTTPCPTLPAHLPMGAIAGAGQDDKFWAVMQAAVDKVDSHGVKVDCSIMQGSPPRTLVELAASAQLLVVGSRGLGRAHEALTGSVSHTCTHHATVPVVVVPDEKGQGANP